VPANSNIKQQTATRAHQTATVADGLQGFVGCIVGSGVINAHGLSSHMIRWAIYCPDMLMLDITCVFEVSPRTWLLSHITGCLLTSCRQLAASGWPIVGFSRTSSSCADVCGAVSRVELIIFNTIHDCFSASIQT